MPKNWQHLGYQLPDEIDPEENICVCVPVPKDWGHIRAFLGQLTELSKWLTWEKDSTDSGARAARRWFDITQCVMEEIDCIMSENCGCGDDKPTNTRINPDTGVYEVSNDGGITWTPAPQDDPRFSGTVFPGIPGGDDDAKRCTAANSITGWMQSTQVAEKAQLDANASVAEAITALIGILAGAGLAFALVPAAIAALLAFVVNTFAHLIPADFEAQFSTTKFDTFFCIAYCEMDADASFTEQAWQRVKSRCVDEIGGYAGQWFSDHVNLLGVVGLTNTARSSIPGTRDCDECDCTEPCLDAGSWSAGTVNSVTDNGDGTVTFNVSSVDNGAGTQYAAWGDRIDAFSPCCIFKGETLAEGTALGSATQSCGSATETYDNLAPEQCLHYFHLYNNFALTTPWTADITLGSGC